MSQYFTIIALYRHQIKYIQRHVTEKVKRDFHVCLVAHRTILILFSFYKNQQFLAEASCSSRGLFKNVLSNEKVKLCFFATFNIIRSHVFAKNFIETRQVAQKIWTFCPFLTSFEFFLDFLAFPCYTNLMTSAHNRWCQQFFSFNIP